MRSRWKMTVWGKTETPTVAWIWTSAEHSHSLKNVLCFLCFWATSFEYFISSRRSLDEVWSALGIDFKSNTRKNAHVVVNRSTETALVSVSTCFQSDAAFMTITSRSPWGLTDVCIWVSLFGAKRNKTLTLMNISYCCCCCRCFVDVFRNFSLSRKRCFFTDPF